MKINRRISSNIELFEQKINYEFKNKEYILEALTHSSYSNENKVGGGYCLSVYANHPYILLNYDNSLDSVSTLVHELGHGVYSYLSQKNQKYYNAQPSIFTHEVASTTNEALLYEFLIKNAGNDKQKAYYITQYIVF